MREEEREGEKRGEEGKGEKRRGEGRSIDHPSIHLLSVPVPAYYIWVAGVS